MACYRRADLESRERRAHMTEDAGGGGGVRNVVRALSRNRLLIVTVTAVSVVAAVILSLLSDPTYSGRAQLKFSTAETQQVLSESPSTQPPEDVAAANSEYVTSPGVVNAVRQRLNRPVSAQELRDSIETRVEVATNLVVLEAHADEATEAADLANAFALETQSFITTRQRELLKRAAERVRQQQAEEDLPKGAADVYAEQLVRLENLARFSSPVQIVSQATVPRGPDQPGVVKSSMLALVLGLLLGSVAALVRESLRRGITKPDQLERSVGLPVAGYLPEEALASVTVGGDNGHSKFETHLDAFRILRANVAFLDEGRGPRSLAVTSPLEGEGKSTVSAGLALAYAIGGARAVVVECNLRRPAQAERLGLDHAPGLADYLSGDATLEQVIQVAKLEGQPPVASSTDDGGPQAVRSESLSKRLAPEFACITAGAHSPAASELLRSDRLRALLDTLITEYDIAILDCAPLLPVSDALELLPRVDAVLMCVRVGQTTEEQCRAAISLLERAGPAKAARLVLTGVEERDRFTPTRSTRPILPRLTSAAR